jgi:hypothetical protein
MEKLILNIPLACILAINQGKDNNGYFHGAIP